MRHVMFALAGAAMLGLGAARAAEPAVNGHQPAAREHHQPAAHCILVEADGSGADVRANANIHHSGIGRS